MAAIDLTTLDNVKGWLGLTGLAISAISQANPAVVTLQTRPSTPLVSGIGYTIAGVDGMTQLTPGTYVITVLSPTTFSIPVNSTGYSPYTGGGSVGIDDPLLTRLITSSSAYIQSWLNRTIATATYTETLNGSGGYAMLMQNYPISAVHSVAINGVTIPVRPALNQTTGTYAGFGYVFDADKIMVSGTKFCQGMQNVSVSYDAGYATTPPDIEQACIDLIGDWFRYRSRIGMLSQAIETQTTTFTNTPMPVRCQDMLQQYKKVAPIGY